MATSASPDCSALRRSLAADASILERKHSLATRLFHWANVPILAVMIWSGLLIYWANDVYAIRFRGHVLFKFFPDWFYERFASPHGWARGWPGISPSCGCSPSTACSTSSTPPSAASGATSSRTGGPSPRRFRSSSTTSASAETPLPRRKFNGAQRLAYTGVIAMGAGSLLTGLAIYKPVQLAWLTWLLGGYRGREAGAFHADDPAMCCSSWSTSSR